MSSATLSSIILFTLLAGMVLGAIIVILVGLAFLYNFLIFFWNLF